MLLIRSHWMAVVLAVVILLFENLRGPVSVWVGAASHIPKGCGFDSQNTYLGCGLRWIILRIDLFVLFSQCRLYFVHLVRVAFQN